MQIFSGRGPLTGESASAVKPDLAAPGVNVSTISVGGSVMQFSGTSFSTPFVTGSAALLMEWGIVRGNDIYLYGEKVKAYLRRGRNHFLGLKNIQMNGGIWAALSCREYSRLIAFG